MESAVFCGSACHVMRPHYAEWKNSDHHDVQCIECHIPPLEGPQFYPDFRAMGRVFSYLTRTYGRYTRAEVEDKSCLREGCHTHRLLEGRVTYATDITFNHTPHLQQLRRGKILRCTTCHTRSVMGEHITLVHDTCFICHLKGDRKTLFTAQCVLCHQTDKLSEKETAGGLKHGTYIQRSVPCYSCHDGVIIGNGSLDEESCNQCHGSSGPEMPREPVEALHRNHVTDHKVECGICHQPIRHEEKDETAVGSPTCDSCHGSRHAGIAEMYRGTGTEDVPPAPSPMFLAGVDCVGCHSLSESGAPGESELKGKTSTATYVSCRRCHGTDMSEQVQEWATRIDATLTRAEKTLRLAESRTEKLQKDTPESADLRVVLDKARHNISFIRTASPVHNSDYAVSVLEKTIMDLEGLSEKNTMR